MPPTTEMLPTPAFFGKKVSKVEGGPVAMDILTGKLKPSLFGLHLSGVHI